MTGILTSLTRIRRAAFECPVASSLVHEVCNEHGYFFRQRLMTPFLTLQLFCLQVLHYNTAITHLRQLAGFDFSPSSYAEARMRLPLAVFQQLLEKMYGYFASQAADVTPPALFGRRLVITDAVTFSMPDTPQLVEHFGLPPGQKPGIGYPVGKVMALMDYATGMFTQLLPVPQSTHDMRGIIGIHSHLKKGDILLGDSAFCSFAHMCLLMAMGVDGVFFLHQRRPKVPGKPRWTKSKKPPAWMTQEQFDALPQFIDVRVIKHYVHQQGYRTQIVYIATTLIDEDAWPDWLLAQMYKRRWDIEVCFDHLKTTMQMNVLKCMTVQGVYKELTVYLIVYNKVRLAMLQTAAKQNVNLRRVSLIDTMRYLAVTMIGLRGVERIIINPYRPGRHQPRVQRRRPKGFPWMTKTRNELKEALFAAENH